ncbi:hypothetical protein LUZ60_000332 [Juncus effusus]|nr:hypothetical protein LUZ60_000332 [Juncus effusus]
MNVVYVRSTPAPATSSLRRRRLPNKTLNLAQNPNSNPDFHPIGCCHCGRRGLLAASISGLLPLEPLLASPARDPAAVMERVHPSRPDFYQELYAKAMSSGMKAYENEIAGYKEKLFSNLTAGSSKKIVLELGVGTGPNFKYYANNIDTQIIGVDPNNQMEKYARASARAAGLPLPNFNFLRGVGEALPVEDSSMDAVVGTLVLCSVKDVHLTLKEIQRVLKPGGVYIFVEHVAAEDGSFLKLMQGFLDPLQQFVADGCHLTRETGKEIARVGFSDLNLNNAFLNSVSLFGPHVYGVACK